MSPEMIDIISWVLLMSGVFFCLVGGIGLLRFPDVFSRMHAAGITDTLGAGLMLGGLMVQAGLTLVCIKLVLVLLFLLITSPASTHALARSALESGLKPKLANDGEVDHS